jgi:hypothetical protein
VVLGGCEESVEEGRIMVGLDLGLASVNAEGAVLGGSCNT